jgi:hypothetical protein
MGGGRVELLKMATSINPEIVERGFTGLLARAGLLAQLRYAASPARARRRTIRVAEQHHQYTLETEVSA